MPEIQTSFLCPFFCYATLTRRGTQFRGSSIWGPASRQPPASQPLLIVPLILSEVLIVGIRAILVRKAKTIGLG